MASNQIDIELPDDVHHWAEGKAGLEGLELSEWLSRLVASQVKAYSPGFGGTDPDGKSDDT